MSAPDPGMAEDRRREGERWLAIARDDTRVARLCLAVEDPAVRTAAYHCQQAAEKLAKACW